MTSFEEAGPSVGSRLRWVVRITRGSLLGLGRWVRLRPVEGGNKVSLCCGDVEWPR